MNKRMISLILGVAILLCGIPGEFTSAASNNSTKYTLQSWDLVDSGKHCDWKGSTNYMVEWYNAVNTWNAYKPGVIRADRWNTYCDVKICDKAAKDGCTFACTFSSGKIEFYQDTMDQMTSTQRQATITHELGHCLGIGHYTGSEDVIMKQGYKNYTTLHQIDKDAYDAAYLKY